MKSSFAITLVLMLPYSLFAATDAEKNIREGLVNLLPEQEISSIDSTPIKGLYQVVLGTDVIYMTGDGNYVLQGDILDVNSRRNITENVRAESRAKLLMGVSENEYIEFKAKDPTDVIYVFTDIDCGYCRKLHRDVPELNARGISVRYLAYPRAGIGSETAKKMESIWCADNRQEALTMAKSGKAVDTKICANPVAKQYQLGRKVGVRGTPAIYLTDGTSIPGYMPPSRLMHAIRQ